MIHGISYSDDNMNQSLAVCLHSMAKQGVGKLTGYGPNWWKAWEHTDTFEWLNKDTLSQNRGGGYWLWKPWCIARAITQIPDGSIIIYSDAGIEWLQPVHEIINRMDQDIFFFTNGFSHVEWCKWDVFSAINKPHWFKTHLGDHWHVSDIRVDRFKQVQASVIFFKVNQNTRNFVKEWLLWCQMPGFIDDSPSKLPNYPTFAEHRHDQAILTCLQIKYGYKLHFWPTAYSEHIRHTALPEDNYPTLFNHHRKRDPGKGGGEPEW